MIKLSKLKPHPNNPRVIKDSKFKQLVKSLEEFPKMMELRPLVVDEAGIIHGGNQRFKALLQIGYKEIPESWVKDAKDFTPEELEEFMIKDNLSSGEWDFAQLKDGFNIGKIEDWGLIVTGPDKVDDTATVDEEADIFNKENMQSVIALNDTAIFRTHIGSFDIPYLLPDKLGSVPVGKNVKTWVGVETDADHYLLITGSNKPPERQLSDFTFCFYTDDVRFEAFFMQPSKYVLWCQKRGITQIVMPNYSMYAEMVQIERMFNLFRSRFVARFFQEAGVNVIPDIQLNDVDYELTIEGIPKGAPQISVQFHTAKGNEEFYTRKKKALLKLIADLEPKSLLLYVDNKAKTDLEAMNLTVPIQYVMSFMTERRVKKVF